MFFNLFFADSKKIGKSDRTPQIIGGTISDNYLIFPSSSRLVPTEPTSNPSGATSKSRRSSSHKLAETALSATAKENYKPKRRSSKHNTKAFVWRCEGLRILLTSRTTLSPASTAGREASARGRCAPQPTHADVEAAGEIRPSRRLAQDASAAFGAA
jgi:hypothetical protein